MPDPIDENPINDGEFTSAEEIGPVVLWPTKAIEGALADRDRLADIIDRARAALDAIPEPDLAWLAKLAALPESDVVTTSRVIALAVLDARAVLAEAEPEDPGR